MGRFRKDMEKMVPQIDSRVKELQEKMSEQPLASVDSDLAKMVKFILDVRVEVNSLKEQAKKLNEY